jgi:hypothetical protein
LGLGYFKTMVRSSGEQQLFTMDNEQIESQEKKVIALSIVVAIALVVISSIFLVEGISNNQRSSMLIADVLPGFALALLLSANTWRLKKKSKDRNSI